MKLRPKKNSQHVRCFAFSGAFVCVPSFCHFSIPPSNPMESHIFISVQFIIYSQPSAMKYLLLILSLLISINPSNATTFNLDWELNVRNQGTTYIEVSIDLKPKPPVVQSLLLLLDG